MLFHNYSDDPTLFKRPVETGNHGVSCFHHLRPIGPPLNPMECDLSEFVVGCSWHRCARVDRDKAPLFSRDWRCNRGEILSVSASVYALQTAINWATLVGIALMHMIKKKQLMVAEGAESLTAAEQFYVLVA